MALQQAADRDVDEVVNISGDYHWVNHRELDTASVFSNFSLLKKFVKEEPLLRSGFYDRTTFAALDERERVYMSADQESKDFTYFYSPVFKDSGIRLPLTQFQESVLCVLNVAPTQLHPNGWSVVRGFEILCSYLGFPVTLGKFFYFFKPKIQPGGAQWVSLYCRRNNLLKPLKSSYKNWKDHFLRISHDLTVAGGERSSFGGRAAKVPFILDSKPPSRCSTRLARAGLARAI